MKQLRKKASGIIAGLKELYPDAHCALNYRNPFELLVATILSAQCTDARVNMVTPELFRKYPDAFAFAKLTPMELEKEIFSTGFYRQKAKNILATCNILLEDYGGKVPADFDVLITFPGVGRKTASVIMGNAYGVPAIAVDTHVKRLSNLFGLTESDNPDIIEQDLKLVLDEKDWVLSGHLFATHGRMVCFAGRPRCEECGINSLCDFYKERNRS